MPRLRPRPLLSFHGPSPPLTPLPILTRILLLQLTFYTISTILLLIGHLILAAPFSPSLLYDWRAVRFDTVRGWSVAGSWAGGALATTVLLFPPLLTRSRLVVDFALTMVGLHVLFTVGVAARGEDGPPRSGSWWALQIVMAAVSWTIGVWVTRWWELRPIDGFQGGAASSSSSSSAARGGGKDGGEEGEGEGLMNGHARGGGGGAEEAMEMEMREMG